MFIPSSAALRNRGAAIDGTRIVLRAERPAEAMVEILAIASEKHLRIRDLSMRRPTLENVFLHLTGRELRE